MTEQNIIIQYLFWQFLEVPKSILMGWRNFLKFGLNYFSIPLLLKTLFSPWHRYTWTYPRGFDIGKYFEVFISNLISRIFGAVLRVLLIIIGILAEIFIIFAGALIFIGWLIGPALLIAGLIFGFSRIIF
ncbi:MAG: hypothetical protein QME57_03635 [Patescibacteria group bacterium]|nr:hypothetical protein [Patescibacteria group bacterium]